MKGLVSLRQVEPDDLPIFFAHQIDPEAAQLAAFPSRDRDAFMTHWTTRILGNPDAAIRAILLGDLLAGKIGAWTDAETGRRLVGYWIGRGFWGRGVASAAVALFLKSELKRPLMAFVAKHNLPSIRVLEKSGFTRAFESTSDEEFLYMLTN
jgi:RimJ/RimL family protein N-acetyltransferase